MSADPAAFRFVSTNRRVREDRVTIHAAQDDGIVRRRARKRLVRRE